VKALEAGHKVLVYCSDVSGAFDKVSRERLIAKLVDKEIHPQLAKLIGSWLEPRVATVVVGRAKSNPFRIQDLVFQGTVLPPPPSCGTCFLKLLQPSTNSFTKRLSTRTTKIPIRSSLAQPLLKTE
jgi:hypothetical protein